MPTRVSYPGVYIEEVSSGVRTITGVATSITAFIGQTESGPVETPFRVFNMSEFEAEFGQTRREFDLGYALQQFFRNGGSDAIIVRVDTMAKAASVKVKNSSRDKTVLEISAKNKGTVGNTLRVVIDHANARDPVNEFNMEVFREVPTSTGGVTLSRLEKFINLSMNSLSAQYVENELKDASRYVSGSVIPAARASLAGVHGSSKSAALHEADIDTLKPENSTTTIRVDGQGPFPFAILKEGETITGTNVDAKLADLATKIQAKIHAIAGGGATFTEVTCEASKVDNDWFLTITSMHSDGELSAVRVADVGSGGAASILKLGARNGGIETDPSSTLRPAVNESGKSYFLGQGGDDVSQENADKGDNGSVIPPTSNTLINAIKKLEEVEIFNLLIVPATATLDNTSAKAVIDVGIEICQLKRAFYLVDPPSKLEAVNPSDPDTSLSNFLDGVGRAKDAAVFYPRVLVPDPANNFRLSPLPSASTVAGVFSRTDTQRGVWKAPAGTDATLLGVTRLDATLTDSQNGILNPLGINVLRSFPGTGNVVWGSRTLDGNDKNASEWKYIPVRRTALFIEESLYRGTQWVVFEPNDEPLWAQIRLNLGAFMHGLFRQGAFQGTTPKDAYFVKCDKETTPQDQINLGIVNIVVGFAPLKPAEFVIIKLQQMAGQIET